VTGKQALCPHHTIQPMFRLGKQGGKVDYIRCVDCGLRFEPRVEAQFGRPSNVEPDPISHAEFNLMMGRTMLGGA